MSGKQLTPESARGALQILQRLTKDDLNQLVFDLLANEPNATIHDIEDIPGDTQNAKALALLKRLQLLGRDEDMVKWLKAKSFASAWEPVWVASTPSPEPAAMQTTTTSTTAFSKPALMVGAIALAAVLLLGTAVVGWLTRQPPGSGSGNRAGTSAARVAFARGPISASTLVIRELRSGKEITLTRVEADTADPTWSPDGQFIAASGGDGSNHDIVIYNTTNGSLNRLTQPGNDIDPDWSRTDDRIYYVRGSLRDGGEIVSVKSNGSDVKSIGLKGRQPTVSPDGSHMAYMQKQADGFWHIHIARTIDWVDVCVLSAGNTSPTPNLRMPNWTADSKGVIFNYADRATEPRGLGYADIKDCTPKVSSVRGTQQIPPLGRPNCGEDFVCVANHSAVTGGNLRRLKFDPASNTFTDEGALTPKRVQGVAEFGPDVYP